MTAEPVQGLSGPVFDVTGSPFSPQEHAREILGQAFGKFGRPRVEKAFHGRANVIQRRLGGRPIACRLRPDG